MDQKPLHLFIIGLDDFRYKDLMKIRNVEDFRFHSLLDYEEVITPVDYPFEEMLQRAKQTIRDFPENIAGVITHWDFPASTMLPLICQEFDLRSASIEAVLKCEHKYWSRLLQREVVPEMTPEFCAIDPKAENPLEQVTIDYPFWIKPIKAFSSHLGYRIEEPDDLKRVIPTIRKRINRIGDPFNVALSHADLPPEIEKVDGNWCIAEEILSGKQCGIEGYVLNGKYHAHGIFDGVKDQRNWSFTRWEYPSVWPDHVQERMNEASRKLMEHIGFDNSPFGIEFFWDEDSDQLGILEINTRISQSHSKQFILVEGVSNHEVAVDVALNRQPKIFQHDGPFERSSKFMLRKYQDAVVERIPTEDEIKDVEASIPNSKIVVTVNEGDQLSDLRDQDSYSCEIANLWLGADSQQEMLEKYRQMADRLHFEFSDGEGPEPFQFQEVRY